MRHLVVGASGQIGAALMRQLRALGQECYGTCRKHQEKGLLEVEIADESSVRDLMLKTRPKFIYSCAALSNIDRAETKKEEAYRTNVTGIKNLVKFGNRFGAKFIHFSTEAVFDGTTGGYREDDTPNPISEYGKQKVYSEHIVASLARDYIIARTTVVYGWETLGKNFAMQMLAGLEEGKPQRVPGDQIGNPTYNMSLARAIIELATSHNTGIYHVCGRDRISRYEFAVEIAKTFNFDPKLITSVPTSELGQVGRRLLKATLSTEKAAKALGYELPGYAEGLKLMKLERQLI